MNKTDITPEWSKELGFNSAEKICNRKLKLQQIIYRGGNPKLREATAKEQKIRHTIKD